MERRLLVVEEQENLRIELKNQLSMAGLQITFVSTGTEAIEKLYEAEYHVVVTDLNVKGIDGMKLISKINSAFPDIACIVYTSQKVTSEISYIINNLQVHKIIIRPVENLSYLELAIEEAFEKNEFRHYENSKKAEILSKSKWLGEQYRNLVYEKEQIEKNRERSYSLIKSMLHEHCSYHFGPENSLRSEIIYSCEKNWIKWFFISKNTKFKNIGTLEKSILAELKDFKEIVTFQNEGANGIDVEGMQKIFLYVLTILHLYLKNFSVFQILIHYKVSEEGEYCVTVDIGLAEGEEELVKKMEASSRSFFLECKAITTEWLGRQRVSLEIQEEGKVKHFKMRIR